jgi:hypothetical protein
MRFAYLTTDEVNQSLAPEMALGCGTTLDTLFPKDGPPDRGYDAVVYDWDSWPVELRQEFLARLEKGPLYRPVAVHAYHLPDDHAEALRNRGVALYRSLHPDVFQWLHRAALPISATDGRIDDGEGQEVEASVG